MKKDGNFFVWLRERRNICFFILTIILSVLMVWLDVTIKTLNNNGNIVWNMSFFAKVFGKSLLLGLPVGIALVVLGYVVCGLFNVCSSTTGEKVHISNAKVFWLSFVLIFLSFIPCWMAYYPGICSYDTDSQLRQIVDCSYVEHHPIIHTLFFRECLELGKRIAGKINLGVAIYSFIQMSVMSFSLSVMVSSIYRFLNEKIGRKKLTVFVSVLVLLFTVSFPANWFMAATMTKDSLFSTFFLLTVVCLCTILSDSDDLKVISKWDMGLFVGLFGVTVFRNNGKYAIIIALCVLILCVLATRKKLFLKLSLIFVFSIAVGVAIMKIASVKTSAVQGDRREMLSVPIQQIARCMVYHGGIGAVAEDDDTISEENKQLINEFILYEAYRDYRPDISDPVKSNTNTYVVRYKTAQFLKTYFELFKDYPGDYINAFLGLNSGFLALTDESYASINQHIVAEGEGYIQTKESLYIAEAGLYKDSKLPGLYQKMDDWVSRNGFLNIPVIKYLFSPALYFWIMIFSFLTVWWKKKYNLLIPMVFIGAYFLTMFFGPTVQLRYVFPIMISAPYIFICVALYPTKQNKGIENEEICRESI